MGIRVSFFVIYNDRLETNQSRFAFSLEIQTGLKLPVVRSKLSFEKIQVSTNAFRDVFFRRSFKRQILLTGQESRYFKWVQLLRDLTANTLRISAESVNNRHITRKRGHQLLASRWREMQVVSENFYPSLACFCRMMNKYEKWKLAVLPCKWKHMLTWPYRRVHWQIRTGYLMTPGMWQKIHQKYHLHPFILGHCRQPISR